MLSFYLDLIMFFIVHAGCRLECYKNMSIFSFATSKQVIVCWYDLFCMKSLLVSFLYLFNELDYHENKVMMPTVFTRVYSSFWFMNVTILCPLSQKILGPPLAPMCFGYCW